MLVKFVLKKNRQKELFQTDIKRVKFASKPNLTIANMPSVGPLSLIADVTSY